MTQSQIQNNAKAPGQIDLWDYLQIIIKKRWMIFRNCALVFFLAVIISLILPKKYAAVATLLPPAQDRRADVLNTISPDALVNLAVLSGNTTAELFVQILLSRTVQQGVLEREYTYQDKKISLKEYFDIESMEAALKKLNSVTTIQALKEGIISVAVELGNPDLAAAVANAYIAELDSINQAKSTSRAKSSRIYIENQLQLTKRRLEEADKTLAEFKQTHKAISLEDQTRAAIEEAGKIKGWISAKEVELAMKLHVQKATHHEVIAIKNELEELRKQYEKLQYGINTASPDAKAEFYIPMAEVPEVALRLAELMREVKVQETVWELLNQQYYQAKIQEAKDTPTVQLLDEAVPPEFKSKPRRMMIVVLSVSVTFFLSIFWAFFEKYLDKVSHQDEGSEKLSSIKSILERDLVKIKQFFQKRNDSKLKSKL